MFVALCFLLIPTLVFSSGPACPSQTAEAWLKANGLHVVAGKVQKVSWLARIRTSRQELERKQNFFLELEHCVAIVKAAKRPESEAQLLLGQKHLNEIAPLLEVMDTASAIEFVTARENLSVASKSADIDGAGAIRVEDWTSYGFKGSMDELIRAGRYDPIRNRDNWGLVATIKGTDIKGRIPEGYAREDLVRQVFWPKNYSGEAGAVDGNLNSRVSVIYAKGADGKYRLIQLEASARDSDGWSPLLYEIESGQWRRVKTIGGKPILDTCIECHKGRGGIFTPLPKQHYKEAPAPGWRTDLPSVQDGLLNDHPR